MNEASKPDKNPTTSEAKELTPKQERFVDQYLVDLNATQAAIRAGYSEKTARAIGHENLTKPNIIAAVEVKKAKLSSEAALTLEKVLTDIERIRQKAEEKGRFMEALKASELQGKYLRMWVERTEHSVDESLASRILAARRRTKALPSDE